MTPSDLRLLTGLRCKVNALRAQLQDNAHDEVIDCIHVILDELIKRQDNTRLSSLYEELKALLKEAKHLLSARGNEELAVNISRLENATADAASDSWNTREYGKQLGTGVACLTRAIDALTSTGESDIERFLHRACLWESRLNAWTESQAHQQLNDANEDAIHFSDEALTGYLRERFPEFPDIEVIKSHKLPGGYSKVTILFDTRDRHNGEQYLVMRAEQALTPFHMDGASIANEYSVLRFAHESGIAVAEPLWLEPDTSRLGTRFLVSRKAEGSIYGSVMEGKLHLSTDDIRKLVAGLVKIHNTPLDPGNPFIASCHLKDWLNYRTLKEFTGAYIKYWQRIAEKNNLGASPILARGFNWLYNNIPDANEKPSFIHGDYSLHNILIKDGEISAILDWEACHIGDPADEFTYFCLALSQHASQNEIVAMYHELGGKPITEFRLRFFEVLNYMKCLITGYGGLALIARHPSVDIKSAYVGYRFMPAMMDLVSDAIQRAEAARKK